MNKYFLWLCIISISTINFAKAQCNEAHLISKPGILKKVNNICGGRYSVAATDKATAKRNLDEVEKIVAENYTPKGCDATYNSTFDCTPSVLEIDNKNRYGNPYTFMLQNFLFLCRKDKEITNAESSITLFVSFNAGIGMQEEQEVPVYYYKEDVTEGMGYRLLDKKFYGNGTLPDVSKGWARFENFWIITKKNQLPYKYVTRKEFLNKQLALYNARIKNQKKLNYDYSNLENIRKAYEKDMQKEETWLLKKAFVKNGADETGVYRYVFTDVLDTYTEVPIQPNPQYYNYKISKAAPQLITVSLSGGHKRPTVSADLIKIIEDRLLNLLQEKMAE